MAAAARIAPLLVVGGDAARDDADVDDPFAPAVEDGVQERAQLRGPAGGPGKGAVEHVEGPEHEHEDPAESHAWTAARIAATQVPANPIRVRAFGVRPTRPMASATGVAMPRTRSRRLGVTTLTMRRSGPAAVGQAEDLPLAVEERLEGGRQEPADRLAADPPGLDEAGGAEATDVPRDERLRQADVVDELRDRRLGPGSR